MTNYKMILQYDGSKYRGWQRQKDTENTIQGKLEQVISRMMNVQTGIDGAGRTDSGVHANAQVANFRGDTDMTCEQIKDYCNQYLPKDIRVLNVTEASPRFHSRLNAVGKEYHYTILKNRRYDVFRERYAWQMERELDVAQMRKACRCLIGKHDFAAFCTKASKKKSTIRDIEAIEIREDENRITIAFRGNGFLYNMVRIMTGTLVQVGLGTLTPEQVSDILDSKNRMIAGEKVPANGLMLWKVFY